MKLTKKQFVLSSFMLFSLFFGAGNLIFPPFLGQNAGSNTPLAVLGFLITAVALPVLGVIVVAKFDGLQKLAGKVNPKFAVFFTILIYLSIGPGLGIPRAASLPFEMAVAPYLPEDAPIKLYMLIFSFVFFSIALWLALTPNKLVERIGKFLTPSLLSLLLFLFISFLFFGKHTVTAPQTAYADSPFIKGFLEGYLTMDTIAALNFGLVIATTIQTFGIQKKDTVIRYTVKTGLFAGTILAVIYLMLSYIGANAGAFPLQDNGAWTLRYVVHSLFGESGAILLASIFTLACLTTCVGLITSCSSYFATLTKRLQYRHFVYIISLFSFLICNQGLNAILSLSVPVLDAIYPTAIVLIVLGLFHHFFQHNRYVYPCIISGVVVVSVVYSLEKVKVSIPILTSLCHYLPFYKIGMGWVLVAVMMGVIAYLMLLVTKPEQQ